MSIGRIGEIVRSIMKVVLVAVFSYAFISLLLTSLWGKQIILLRTGLSQSEILYETPSRYRNVTFIIFNKNNEYGLVQAYPNGRLNILNPSYYSYSVNVKTGAIRYSSRYELQYNPSCSLDSKRENVGVKARNNFDDDGNPVYKYFVVVHRDKDPYKNHHYEFRYELGDQTIYFFDSSSEIVEPECLNVKFI